MMDLLIADDNTDFSTKLCSYLVKNNRNIRLADITSDGISTLKSIQSLLPDVIILDLDLPGLNGNKIIEKIGKIENYRPFIIIVSGRDDLLNEIIDKHYIYCFIHKGTPLPKILSRVNDIVHATQINDYTQRIEEELISLHFVPSNAGYKYLLESINLVKQCPHFINNMQNSLFAVVAKKFEITKEQVKWGITYTINMMYKRNSSKVVCDYFSLSKDIKPTPTIVINTISQKIQ